MRVCPGPSSGHPSNNLPHRWRRHSRRRPSSRTWRTGHRRRCSCTPCPPGTQPPRCNTTGPNHRTPHMRRPCRAARRSRRCHSKLGQGFHIRSIAWPGTRLHRRHRLRPRPRKRRRSSTHRRCTCRLYSRGRSAVRRPDSVRCCRWRSRRCTCRRLRRWRAHSKASRALRTGRTSPRCTPSRQTCRCRRRWSRYSTAGLRRRTRRTRRPCRHRRRGRRSFLPPPCRSPTRNNHRPSSRCRDNRAYRAGHTRALCWHQGRRSLRPELHRWFPRLRQCRARRLRRRHRRCRLVQGCHRRC
jgi:hypothetical protein